MPRRLLEVFSPAPTKPKMQGLFFFLGASVVLLILLIVLFIFWKFIKPREIMMKLVLRKNKGEVSKDFFSCNLRTIIYFDFQTLKKATKDFHPEIISCRKNTDLTLPSEMQYLPEYAWKLHERSKVIDLVDPRMRENGFENEEVMQAINVAFLCLQPHANRRPRMSEVVAMLTCKVEMVEIPIRPAFLDRRRKRDETLSWDTISEPFPSPPCSESLSLPQQPN
ncbi:hypothetical protein QYF36_012082 [Acer negundo]|nr:hypothetical protein QYF36_012082 [Acer negundo]